MHTGKIAETFEEEIGVTVEESRTTTTVVTETTTTIESTSEDNTKRAPPKNLVTSWGNTKVLRSNSLKTKQISNSGTTLLKIDILLYNGIQNRYPSFRTINRIIAEPIELKFSGMIPSPVV